MIPRLIKILVFIGLTTGVLVSAFDLPDETVELELNAAVEVRPALELHLEPKVEVLPEPRTVESNAAWHGPIAQPRYTLRATAYNSLPGQTQGNPHVTATGARTQLGVIAVSRDLLGWHIPYGSLVRIRDLGNYHSGKGYGAFQHVLNEQALFIVEDTMHARKRQQVDIWFPTFAEARQWGVRQVEIEVVRYGREGPVLDFYASALNVTPKLSASR